ncbi:MAG: T9SS type A sorting domain-containing protein [Candidatus Omnitrophica bacterium]|nr:T9SS type A sorting domain-containing protein [Candidatus Omnitrophota bacterium]
MIDTDGKFEYSNIISIEIPAPNETRLLQNYPNAFNSETTIEFQISSASRTVIQIFDVRGELIHTIVNDILEPGYYSRKFNYKVANLNLSSGVYFYRLIAQDLKTNHITTKTKKMLLMQ